MLSYSLEPLGEPEDRFNNRAASCGADYESYYFSDGTWFLPDGSRIVSDLIRCGGSVPIFLNRLLPQGSAEERSILLGAILMEVRKNPTDRANFQEAREAAEEAKLIEIHDQMYENARKGDVPSQKFLLERRARSLFGKDAKGVDDTEEFIKEETRKFLER